MKTIHLITSAHLDPIWLWPWQNGLDAVLNTCRTMVALLHRHPEVIFTCGEAWKYRQVERLAPQVFAEIRKLVEAGRWEIVGGWWIQPDCNAPSGFALERQIELGMRYFRDTFGRVPTVGFNVDSFGHAATLPGYLRAAGQSHYVMMRPQENEMTLPARVFRWQGYDDGPAVTTFRIAGGYGDFDRINEQHVRMSLNDLPDGVEHTMCFLGVGDHGGGPNERLMTWMREHRSAFEDVNLVWSSPSRYFAAIEGQADTLPTHTGELQHHAVGCYSVYRPVKTAVRHTEHLLAQAETVATDADRTALDEHWRTTCFHHFHDTLGGTCLPSAYPQVEAELGGVRAYADTLLHTSLRRQIVAMPSDSHHRIVLHNASDRPHTGYAAWEYWWRDGGDWQPHWQLLDEQNRVVPHQLVATEAVVLDNMQSRLTFRADLAAGETRVLRVNRGTPLPVMIDGSVETADDTLRSAPGVAVAKGRITLAGRVLPVPQLHLIDDPTDTWSHGVDRYGETPVSTAEWDAATVLERGPLVASVAWQGRLGVSPVQAEYRLYRGEPYVELLLRVDWTQRHQVLKLVWPTPAPIVHRDDGIPGGTLARPGDGKERPVRDFTQLHLQDGTRLGVVCPDVFALDATAERVRFTLLRGALMAHHDPAPARVTGRYADNGTHEFRFRFYVDADVQTLDDAATAMQRPLLVAETTDGMPAA